MTGSLWGPLARIKVDVKICFGMIEWKAVRGVAWKHRNLSFVEQSGKDRGAEQGDVGGPPGVQPGSGHGGNRNARKHCRAASGGHPPLDWPETQPECRSQPTSSLAAQKSSPVPKIRNTRCRKTEDPILVLPFLQDFDVANARVGAERNPPKTEVIYCVNDLDAAPPEWRVGDVRSLAKTSAATDGGITLGVAVGPLQFITDQRLSKADVIRTMHERVQLCQDPQTEFTLFRESLGVSRINHTLRVHGHTILEEQRAAEVYDEIGQRSLERLFPGLTEDSMTQCRRSKERETSLLLHTWELSTQPNRASRL